MAGWTFTTMLNMFQKDIFSVKVIFLIAYIALMLNYYEKSIQKV